MNKIIYLAIALLGYSMFGLVFAYYAFWLVGAVVPWTINDNAFFGLTSGPALSLVIDALLIGAFLIPHSVMARPAFKAWITKFLPSPLERSVYVWYSNLSMLAMIVLWQPVSGALWSMGGGGAYALYGVYALGAFIIVAATFCIDHFALFGLRQAALKGDTKGAFHVRFVYKLVRHPIALGHLIMVWAAPVMSISHLLYTVLASFYVVFVTYKYEEKDLINDIGEPYLEYKKKIPGIFPVKFK